MAAVNDQLGGFTVVQDSVHWADHNGDQIIAEKVRIMTEKGQQSGWLFRRKPVGETVYKVIQPTQELVQRVKNILNQRKTSRQHQE